MTQPSILLVHGAWHGAWCWDTLLPHLEESGLATRAVDLPSAGAGGDLAADATVVAGALEAIDGPAVVVGHSYGGNVITEATAGRDDVAALVYVCAFQLDEGESLFSALQGPPPPWIAVDAASDTMTVTTPEAVFYADVDPATAAAATARLSNQTVKSFADPLTAVGWRDHPSTYIACTDDRAIPIAAQEAMSARATQVHTLTSSHSPFLSHPGEIASIIAGVAAGSGRRRGDRSP